MAMQYVTATYSPEDNKLRISSVSRFDKEDYNRLRAAGFIWAPKQGVFVAPMWTPEREDLCIELAGEVGDEDTSLVERAEQRAERFEEYSERRSQDADRAHAAVHAIADGIPMGQPILVGHHSERHARRDTEKIENGMRKAVKMWETSKYWESRAAGAIRHAKYKELPAVRARRIKGLEADLRRILKTRDEMEELLRLWTNCGEDITHEQARAIGNYKDHSSACYPLSEYPRELPVSQYEGPMGIWSALGDTPELGIITPKQARERRIASLTRYLDAPQRWREHYQNRLTYERAMLAEGGGLVADKFDFAIGGQIKRRGEWLIIHKINRKDGVITSLSVFGHFESTVPVEDVQDYRPPAEGAAEKVAKVTAQKPLCNWKAPGCIEMTTAEWKAKRTDAWAVRHFDANHKYVYNGAKLYRQRSQYRCGGNYDVVHVFLTDAKVVMPPASVPIEPVHIERLPRDERTYTPKPAAEPTVFDAMRETLKTGVQVVATPQLFPTPQELAERMVEAAELEPGMRVLEPSAGTGRILDALDAVDGISVVAIEISHTLVDNLRRRCGSRVMVEQGDFLSLSERIEKFDAVIMNPPFENGADIKHIRHALQFLKPGGRLVAICANGPRQRAKFRDELLGELCGSWEDLPEGTFESSGTGVRTAMLVLRQDAAPMIEETMSPAEMITVGQGRLFA